MTSLNLSSIKSQLEDAKILTDTFFHSNEREDIGKAIDLAESAVREMKRELTPNEGAKEDAA